MKEERREPFDFFAPLEKKFSRISREGEGEPIVVVFFPDPLSPYPSEYADGFNNLYALSLLLYLYYTILYTILLYA